MVLDDANKEVIPVFKEITIPSRLQPVEVYTKEKRLDYITDNKVRKTVEDLLNEIQNWDKEKIVIEPIKYDISIKVAGRVFMYLKPRRKHFLVSTYDNENKWTDFSIQQPEDLNEVKILLKSNMEKFK